MRLIVIKSTMYNMIGVRNIKLILTANCYLNIYKFFLKIIWRHGIIHNGVILIFSGGDIHARL